MEAHTTTHTHFRTHMQLLGTCPRAFHAAAADGNVCGGMVVVVVVVVLSWW